MGKFILSILFSVVIAQSSLLFSCPFANFKKGRYKRKEVMAYIPQVSPKEVISNFYRRYEIGLNQLQFNYPYDLIQMRQQISLLESYIKVCDSHQERKAVKKTARCLKLLVQKTYKPNLVGKDRYKYFVEIFRIAIDSKNNASWSNLEMKGQVDKILQDIAYSHFTINLNDTPIGYKYFWELFPKEMTNMELSQLNAKLLNKTVNKILPASSLTVLFSRMNRKMHYPFFTSWDSALATIRSKVANYQWEDRNVSLLRMSCPIYGKNYRSKIDPIFEQYLSALKSKNQKHLYISNLDLTASAYSKEFKLSKMLLNLSNQKEYQNVFLFITLPLDSAFYKQGNLGLLRADYFKETFLDSMLLKQEGFYFPSSFLTDSKFIGFLDQLLDEIHKAYFEEKEFLERIERCQFIDIAYAYIAKFLIEQNEISKVNWTCRHGIDRSMNAVAVFDVLLQSLSKAPPHLDSTIYIASWPAMLYYHRHPETSRTVRCYSAIQKLLEKRVEIALPKTDPLDVQDLALLE